MLSGISIWQLLILLGIVVLVFGTKKLRNLGGDLGGAIRSFRNAMKDPGEEQGEGASETNRGEPPAVESAPAASSDASKRVDTAQPATAASAAPAASAASGATQDAKSDKPAA